MSCFDDELPQLTSLSFSESSLYFLVALAANLAQSWRFIRVGCLPEVPFLTNVSWVGRASESK